jgi:hypothetical protein
VTSYSFLFVLFPSCAPILHLMAYLNPATAINPSLIHKHSERRILRREFLDSRTCRSPNSIFQFIPISSFRHSSLPFHIPYSYSPSFSLNFRRRPTQIVFPGKSSHEKDPSSRHLFLSEQQHKIVDHSLFWTILIQISLILSLIKIFYYFIDN